MSLALNELLKQTARSFYLTLRVLPAAVRPQIGLAWFVHPGRERWRATALKDASRSRMP